MGLNAIDQPLTKMFEWLDTSQFYIILKQMDKMTSCEKEFSETQNLRKFLMHVL